MAWGADAELLAPPEGRARLLALLDGAAASLRKGVAR
jgi:hypothetical protein